MVRMLVVRNRRSARRFGRLAAPLVLLAASVAFVAGGVRDAASLGGVVFTVLGVLGIAAFGAAVVVGAGGLISARPVLELDEDGVRRPAPWPRSRRADRLLPWPEVSALCLVRRGVPTRRRGVQDHLIFLTGEEAAEHARSAAKPQLVALTLTEPPPGVEASPWRFEPASTWDASLKDIAAEARRHGVRIIDRRAR